MEKLTYAGNNQRTIESFLLVFYGIYDLVMIILSIRGEWASWITVLLLAGFMCSLIVHVGKYKDFSFRAKFTTIMMQSSLLLYATQIEDYTRFLPVFIVFVVALGSYGIAELIWMTAVSATFLFIYQGFVVQNIPFSTTGEVALALMQIGNIYLVEYIVYVWTRRNSEGSRQLLKAIKELEAIEDKKDDFLANVSHEIRTPINTICGMSEIVLREELPYEIKENILNIQMSGRNLMTVVGNILDFSELQSGKMELEEEAYNITSTINDVINMTLARKNEKKIELIVDCDANIPCALFGDEKKLRRVIMNLVDNAIKFTDEGCVSIVIGYRKESYGINLVVTIKDTGIGMDAESLERLFTRFNQVDTSRKRKEEGVGLGLAISQALVQKMGGAITIKSKPGKGCVVKFVIPQKVLDNTPIVLIKDRENINVATYIDMEQFGMMAIRDEYSSTIAHMMDQLKTKYHICRNLAELERREKKEQFSHIFISIAEYQADAEYFDNLSKRAKVIVVIDRFDERYISNPRLLKIYKPFYILTMASVLNGEQDIENTNSMDLAEQFVTRDAHVLVVDDNKMNLKVIEGLLTGYKLKVTKATNGQEALEKIVTADYDFVFMDHMMPEMDGVETLHHIRHKVGSYYQKVPIIALTANAVAGSREQLLAEGFTDFVEKPIERSILERVLKRTLPSEKIVSKADYDQEIEKDKDKEEMPAVVEEEKVLSSQADELQPDESENDIAGEVDWEQELAKEGLDVAKGIVFCNGKEQYINILRGFCEECDDSDAFVEEMFEKQDWHNYTIAVHGIKGAMRSIGAIKISELARQLEMAGKEGRIDFILEHHNELLEKYRKFFARLREKEWLCPNLKADAQSAKGEENLQVLERKVFEQKIAEMETAMYDLDGEKILEIMSELQNYHYRGTPLNTLWTSVERKVEMFDYTSAVDVVVRFKNSLDSKEEKKSC